MGKTREEVIPRSKLTAHMPPGAGTPRSGGEAIGTHGDRAAKGLADGVAGRGRGEGWKLVGPAGQKHK